MLQSNKQSKDLKDAIIEAAKDGQHEKNQSSDHIYYNATIFNSNIDPNGQAAPIPAIYREVRSDAIIAKPEDWYLSVVRMKIPLDNVPLFYFTNTHFTSTGQSVLGSPILDHFPQMLSLSGQFTNGSAIISNIEDPSGIAINLTGLRIGPLTKIYISNTASNSTAQGIPSGGSSFNALGLIPGNTYVVSTGVNSLTMSVAAVSSVSFPANSKFSFIIDTASGFNETPVPNFSSLATLALQSFSPPTPATQNPVGAIITDLSGQIQLQNVTTTQLIRETNSTSTNLYPPGEIISAISTPYSVSLVYPITNPPIPSNTYSAMVIPTVTTVTAGYFVSSVQEFLDAINLAFFNAFQALIAANPGFPGQNAPYVVFNPATQLFIIVGQKGSWYYDNVLGGQIYLSPLLSKFFHFIYGDYTPNVGFPQYLFSLGATAAYPSGNIFTVAIAADPYDNPAAYQAIQIEEQFSSTCQWNHIEKLVVVSGSLPIQYEYLANTSSTGFQLSSSANFQAVLVDFLLAEIGLDRCEAVYNANPYRLIDLRGTTALTSFDIQILVQDRDLHNFPLLISPGDYAEIKFLFRKKFLGT